MARSRSRKRPSSAQHALLEKGITACAFGIAMLVVPSFMGPSPLLAGIAGALRPIGWAALALGIALLVLQAAVRKKQTSAASGLPPIDRPPRASTNRIQPVQPRTEPRGWDDASPLPASSRSMPPPAAPSAAPSATRQPATQWSPAVFAAIEWRRFEAVCEALFAQAGFETRSQSHGADGGVDIWLHSRHSTGPVSIVQCKHWQGKAVGVREMREFYGVMAANRLQRGTYATTSTYTADAQQFAKDNGISALDGASLLALIAKRTQEQQQALLAVAFEGDYWRPTCASCGTKMVERTPSKGGARFWGCSHYPSCRRTLPMAS